MSDWMNGALGAVTAPPPNQPPQQQPNAWATPPGDWITHGQDAWSSGHVGAGSVPGIAPNDPGANLTVSQGDAFASISDMLGQYGLTSLSQFVYDQLVAGHTQTQITQGLRQTPEFAARFPAIAARSAAGLPPVSPAEYVGLEKSYGEMMRQAGIPQQLINSDTFNTLITNDTSPSELSERINLGYQKVAQAPAQVRDAFQRYFGVSGGAGALAAFFIDPAKSAPVVEHMAATAQVGGMAAQAGFDNLGQQVASDIATSNPSEYRLMTGFGQLANVKPLFSSTIGETLRGNQLSVDQGLSSVFLHDANAQQAIQQRQQQRQADFGGGGGAVQSAKVGGLGAANQ